MKVIYATFGILLGLGLYSMVDDLARLITFGGL